MVFGNQRKKLIYGRSDEKDIVVRYYKDKINDLKSNNTDEADIIDEWFK